MRDRRSHADRRESGKRRESGERRKPSEPRHAAIEIADSSLRLAVVQRSSGKSPDTVVTRSTPWRIEATSLYSDAGKAELLTAFRKLVTEEKLTGLKLRITLGGMFCVTRVLTGSIDEVRRELSQLEERSQLYLSLGPGRKALARSVRSIDARHQHALLTVSNQKTLDVLVHVAETVGVTIESIESSLVALSRAVGNLEGVIDEPYLVIYLDDESAELGICHGGTLLLDYRPGGISSPEELSAVVRQHLSRLRRYCRRSYSFVERDFRRALLCGNPKRVSEATEVFAKQDQLDVEVLDPARIKERWKFVDGPPGSEMAAVLGTVLASGRSETEMFSPNLMEHLLTQSRGSIRPFLMKALAPLAATLAVAAALFWQTWREGNAVRQMRDQLTQLAPAQARANQMQLNLKKAKKLIANLTRIEAHLTRRDWSWFVTTVGQCMPDDVWLDRLVVVNDSEVSLSGASYADTGIYEFVQWLGKAPRLDQVALQGTQASQTRTGPTINFDVQLLLVDQGNLNGSGAEQ